jgi:hypothetical protein
MGDRTRRIRRRLAREDTGDSGFWKVFAVAGTIIAAAVSGFIPYCATQKELEQQREALNKQLSFERAERKSERKREQREQERAVQVAARIMLEDFAQAASEFCRVGRDAGFLLAVPPLQSDISEQDRRLLAGELRPAQWRSVSQTDDHLELWERLWARFKGRQIYWREWGLEGSYERTTHARRALAGLAGYSRVSGAIGDECDSSEWKCPTRRTAEKPDALTPDPPSSGVGPRQTRGRLC